MQKFFIFVSLALFIIVLGFEVVYPYHYLAPDSFTYFRMAREVWERGLLFSYSGIDHTTGVHPGFYLLLIPFYGLLGTALSQWSFVIGGACLALGLYSLYRALGGAVALTVLLLMLTPFGVSLTNNGMESSLLFLALSLVVWALVKGARPWMLGLVLGLAVLARLDTVFLAAAVYGVWVLRDIRVPLKTARAVAVSLAPFIAILAIIIFMNVHYGGSIIPISGDLKSSFPHPAADWLSRLIHLKVFILSLVVTGAYLAWGWWKHRTMNTLVAAFFLGVGALWLYNGLFVSDIGAWYGALPFFALALTISLVTQELSLKPMIATACVGVSAVLIIYLHVTMSGEDWVTPHQVAAEFLTTHSVPADAVGELKDGVFGFYSPMPVYSLTGLASNAEYVEALQSGTIAQYLKAHHIEYIVGGTFGSGVQVPGAAHTFDECSNPVYDTGIVEIFKTADCL